MNTSQEIQAEIRETGRLEAFSDGVLAIAITLLVLEIRLTADSEASLITQFLDEWPSYIAYIISFITIGIMWVNHDSLFKMIRRTDRTILLLNVLLLMLITFLNFPTVVLAEHIQTDDAGVAALIYSGTLMVIALFYSLIWWYVLAHQHLLHSSITPDKIKTLSRQYAIGLSLYVMAFLLGFINATLCVAVCFGLAVFFALSLNPARSTAKV